MKLWLKVFWVVETNGRDAHMRIRGEAMRKKKRLRFGHDQGEVESRFHAPHLMLNAVVK